MSHKIIKCLLMGLLAPVLAVAALPLTDNGRPVAEIVVDGDRVPPQIVFAAEELQNWIGKITGATLPIVKEAGTAKTRIHLGTPEFSPSIKMFAEKHKSDLEKMQSNDGFAIRTSGSDIYIFALDPKGVLNGVYRFLEKNSDIIFVRPLESEAGFGTIFGQHPTLQAIFVDTLDIPVFDTRFMTGDVAAYTWQARNLGVGEYGIEHIGSPETFNALNRIGTRMQWQSGFENVLPTKAYERYYPQFDGKPQIREEGYNQLCFTNPEMINEYINRLDKVIQNAPPRVKQFGIRIGDSWDLCQCETCSQPITLPGGVTVNPKDEDFRSVQFFMFVNDVAGMMAKKHPGKTLAAQAYLWCAQSPRLKLGDNVTVRYCPYVKNHKFPITHPVNKLWFDRFAGWPVASQHLELYEYYLCYTTPLFCNPVCDIAAQDFRFYVEKGLKGAYLDTTRSDNPDATLIRNYSHADVFSASAIEFWVMMRLMWDPAQDVEKLRDEFCRRAYREAAAPMREYYAKIRAVWLGDAMGCGWNNDPTGSAKQYILGNNLTEPLSALLEQAAAQAVHPGSKALIDLHRKVFDKWVGRESPATQK